MHFGCISLSPKTSPFSLYLAILLASACWPTRLSADQPVTLAWDASPDTNAVGYVLYYGTASGAYDFRLDVATNKTVTVANLTEGQTYFFVVTAYDSEGMESEPSNEVTFVVPGILLLTLGPISGLAVLRFPASVNLSCELQASSDLRTWQLLTRTTSLVNGWVEVFDLAIPPPPVRFYRLQFVR